MSQEKVERYKKEKANRKDIIKKEKRNAMITKVVCTIVGLAIVGWLGFSVYDSVTSAPASGEDVTVDMDSIEEYMAGLAE